MTSNNGVGKAGGVALNKGGGTGLSLFLGSRLLVNVCRVVVAQVFIFSGYVKAIDPLGTQYKINDYLAALSLADYVPQFVTLIASVLLSGVEFCAGIFLLFAIHRRLVSRFVVLFIGIMTVITLWLAVADPVKDCGCFGDAVALTNWQTFGKNLVLLTMSAVACYRPLRMVRFISKTNQWIIINYTALFIIVSSMWSLYDLPVFDFRPYHVGADIHKGMEIPEDAEQPQFATTFILEKDGERREFTLDNYPDSTWTFIDSRSEQTSEGYVPPIHDFFMQTAEGDDVTEEILGDTSYTFLLVSPHLENADDTNFGEIDRLYEYAQSYGYRFVCLTASGEKAIVRWRELTGAEYEFYAMDEITLKTMIRSNPGLMLIKDGKVIRKWSHNRLPTAEEMGGRLDRLEIGKVAYGSVAAKIIGILLWFALPLFLLTLADRLWAWTRWIRNKQKSNRVYKLLKERK